MLRRSISLRRRSLFCENETRAYIVCMQMYLLLVRDLLATYGGTEIFVHHSSGCICVLDDAITATKFCMALQEDAKSLQWPMSILRCPLNH